MEEYKKKTNTGDDVILRVQPSATRHAAAAAAAASSPPSAAASPADPSALSPPPTAVVLGWFAGKARNVAKYTAVYERMGYNSVQLVAPFSVVFPLNPRSTAMFLLSLMRILACDERLTAGGLVFHLMSNGGAVVAPHLSHFFSGRHDDFLKSDDRPAVDVTKNHIAAVVFDSSPAYLRSEAGATAINTGLGVTSPLVATMITTAFTLMSWLQCMLFIDLPRYFWDGVRHADYFAPELYVYSRADVLLDVDALEALVEERKRDGREVRVLAAEDAEHVKIMMAMPDKYMDTIATVNDWGVNAWRKNHSRPPWDPSASH